MKGDKTAQISKSEIKSRSSGGITRAAGKIKFISSK